MVRENIRHSIGIRPLPYVVLAVIGIVLLWLKPINFGRPMRPVLIYRGVWYSCVRIESEDELPSLAHIVQVDLSAPGIELYVTPLDPHAQASGAQYKLAFARGVADSQRLAVVINGTQFKAYSTIPLPGTLADSNETLIADGRVNHIHPHSYLLWFDDSLSPHMETTKPPRPEALTQARWGISGVSVAMYNGKPRSDSDETVDSLSCIGVNPQKRLLWLAVFERASRRVAMQTLADYGATEAIRVDGGDSSAMVIGSDALGIDPGTVFGGNRPVPTFFGVRAQPIGIK